MRISDWSSDVCSSDLIDLLEVASAFFALPLPQVRAIIKEVAVVTATWRDTAKTVGARSAEITRMASAFAPSDLTRAPAPSGVRVKGSLPPPRCAGVCQAAPTRSLAGLEPGPGQGAVSPTRARPVVHNHTTW